MSYHANSQTTAGGEIPADPRYRISVDRFLSDPRIPQIAKDLYREKATPTDNFEWLSLIDSLHSTGEARGFYFLVITRTLKHADGAFAEPLAMAAREFVGKNTIGFLSYFLNNPDLLSGRDFTDWAVLVYSDIKIDSENSEQQAVIDLQSKMQNNCKGQATPYFTKIDEFIGRMK